MAMIYSTDDEFHGLKKAGILPHEILRMLTTAPSAKFGGLQQQGVVEAGRPQDLVLLLGDPLQDN